MAGRRSPGGRACCGRRTDVACAGHTVQRLSEERVHELAEEIWTASTGTTAPAGPNLDPRSSQPGASAQAAYRRRRQEEHAAWRPGWWRRAGMMAAATIGRCEGPTWASALRMKCTRQRCQVADSTFAAAAFSPSWASEMTSLTPRRPRRVK